jgi:antirestriction protein ArdC
MNKVYSIIADAIIAKLKEGVVPWKSGWKSGFAHSRPCNFDSKRPYRGINWLLTAMSGFASPYWLTKNGIKKLGGTWSGKATKVVHWSFTYYDFANKKVKQDGNWVRKVPSVRYYNVWNAEQIEGIDFGGDRDEADWQDHDPIASAEEIIAGYKDGPKITIDGTQPRYNPAKDEVFSPELKQFESAAAYYHPLFHELGHSTGHDSRLSRDGITGRHRFGSDGYAFEELVAELTSCFLCSEAGIDAELDNSAAYIQSWIKSLEEHPDWVIKAGGLAQKAVERIVPSLAYSPEKATEEAAAA